ncbi:MAG: HD domain-containing protein, partial [Flavobacteriaceae bacterium]
MRLSKKLKVINDPVYNSVSVPSDLLFDVISHPYFQRLRRITQMGLSYLVYPGAHHTRFHHALGAMHLMQKAIGVLKSKGVPFTEEEEEGLLLAILMHDIGHGPFSHALEYKLVPLHHEALTLAYMQALNTVFDQRLTTAIAIFKGEYPRTFLNQLVSSQLDIDRLDYLKRDSFYAGVTEGNINAERLINTFAVVDDRLVVEEKAIYSVEKFLMARRFMYWQVYLHKTSIVAELMLSRAIERASELIHTGVELTVD